MAENRRAEIAANLRRVRERIDAACQVAGRDPGEITLIAVTKTFPASDTEHLAGLGVSDLGENRAADAATKAEAAETAGIDGLVWHFVGQCQTNKAGVVAACADVVHSVDRPRLVVALDRAAGQAGRRITALVQVDLDQTVPGGGPTGRGGAAPPDVPALAQAVTETRHLRLGGVMAVAPAAEPPQRAFARLEQVAGDLRREHPGAKVVSAGMSDDLEAAILHGATHLRVGTALLGSRPLLR